MADPKEHYEQISLDRIRDPDNPMRATTNDAKFNSLVDSIRIHGILNPILVRPDGDIFRVVAGHRRFAAALVLKAPKVPCVVREFSDEQAFSAMVAENLDRTDVNPADEAQFIYRLMKQYDWTDEAVAAKVHRSIKWVQDRLKIAGMDEFLVNFLRENKISIGVALALNEIDHEKTRRDWVWVAVRGGCTVAQAKNWVRLYYKQKNKYKDVHGTEPTYTESQPIPEILHPCFKCKQQAKLEDLMSVSIHKAGCPVLNVPPPEATHDSA